MIRSASSVFRLSLNKFSELKVCSSSALSNPVKIATNRNFSQFQPKSVSTNWGKGVQLMSSRTATKNRFALKEAHR